MAGTNEKVFRTDSRLFVVQYTYPNDHTGISTANQAESTFVKDAKLSMGKDMSNLGKHQLDKV